MPPTPGPNEGPSGSSSNVVGVTRDPPDVEDILALNPRVPKYFF